MEEKSIFKCPLRFNLENQNCIKEDCQWYMYLGLRCDIEECAIEVIARGLFNNIH